MTNTTDLHIQYHMETGKWFQWDNSKYNINAFHGEDGYTAEYTKWLEEKLLKELQTKQDVKELNELLEHTESEIEYLQSQNDWLEGQVEYYSARDGGGQ